MVVKIVLIKDKLTINSQNAHSFDKNPA